MERYRKKDMLQTVDTLLRANDVIIKTVRSNSQGVAEALVCLLYTSDAADETMPV